MKAKRYIRRSRIQESHLGDFVVDPIGAFPNVIPFFDLREHPTSNAYHPKEFVDVIAGVSAISHLDILNAWSMVNYIDFAAGVLHPKGRFNVIFLELSLEDLNKSIPRLCNSPCRW